MICCCGVITSDTYYDTMATSELENGASSLVESNKEYESVKGNLQKKLLMSKYCRVLGKNWEQCSSLLGTASVWCFFFPVGNAETVKKNI